MAKMRILIKIVFAIFIANGIDCLGEVCDNCCDCLKVKEYEEIEGDENDPAKELVNKDWYNAKKNKPVLKMFIKEENGVFKDNKNKVSFKLEGNNNPKIAYQNGHEDKLKLKDKKYALFEIKTQEEETVYLYCSDIESSGYNDVFNGIFEKTNHKSISVIACDTENVTDMSKMFFKCSKLTELNLQNFNTTNVVDMEEMFVECSELTELNLQNFNTSNVTYMSKMFFECSKLTDLNLQNFNTSNVEDMSFMFYVCSSLKKLDLKIFNTEKVTNMEEMFAGCGSLKELDLKNFDTINVKDMRSMFCGCSSLEKLEFGENFNTTNVVDMEEMFYECSSLKNLNYGQNFNTTKVTAKENMFDHCDKLPDDIKNKFSNKNK